MPDGPVIDADLVGRLVRDQFPKWAALTVRPVADGGWDNRTFHLGDDMSVRLPSAAAYAPQVDKEARWLPYLAPRLPLPIPVPLAIGTPGPGYPWPWSVRPWLPGRPLGAETAGAKVRIAGELAGFLAALQSIEATDGPAAGPHSFWRGGPLAIYDAETRLAIAQLQDAIDIDAATRLWEAALDSTWDAPPVWVHGDVAPGNLLAQNGSLAAVIDFGCMATGDPACDLTIAWTYFEGDSREIFRSALPLDPGTWARARGWTLWKALTRWAGPRASHEEIATSRRMVEDVLVDAQLGSRLPPG